VTGPSHFHLWHASRFRSIIHRLNGEGGIIAEEWRVENIIDRVDTTGLTWLGLTLGCARCPRSPLRSAHAEGVLPTLRVLQQRS